MGLRGEVQSILQAADQITFRPAQVYAVATGAYTIFNVRNGAVVVKALIGRITAAAVGATTIATTLNTVAGEAGAVACNGAVGTLVVVPLNVAAVIVNLAAAPLTDALLHPKGMAVGTQPAGPGLIVATYDVGTSLTMEWVCVWQALSPNALVTLT
jgi:hypothetical protein